MKYLFALSLILATPAFSQTIEQEITEGKILASEADGKRLADIRASERLEKDIERKSQIAQKLIAQVAEMANEYTGIGHDFRRENAKNAHSGYIAIIQSIREDRETLAKRNLKPDVKTLQLYSNRLDYIINDAQEVLK